MATEPDYIDTREGWHIAPLGEPTAGKAILTEWRPGSPSRVWVREEPVLPLPTAPYTVIRVTWRKGGVAGLTLTRAGTWRGTELDYLPEDLSRAITGWEPLAEPLTATEERIRGLKARIAQVERQNLALMDRQNEIHREAIKDVHDYLMALPDYYGADRVATKFGVKKQ